MQQRIICKYYQFAQVPRAGAAQVKLVFYNLGGSGDFQYSGDLAVGYMYLFELEGLPLCAALDFTVLGEVKDGGLKCEDGFITVIGQCCFCIHILSLYNVGGGMPPELSVFHVFHYISALVRSSEHETNQTVNCLLCRRIL